MKNSVCRDIKQVDIVMQNSLIRQYKVAVLALQDASATTIIGPQDVFSMAGVLYEMSRGEEPKQYFSVRVVTADGQPVNCYNGLQITPHCAMQDFEPDIVLIPGILNIDATLQRSEAVLDWLKMQSGRGCLLTTVCSGSMLLAATGLLDGRISTTHWAMVNQFRKRYPKVILRPDELITEDSGIICSGGFNAFLDVSIYVIEKFCGPEVALQSSKIFLHDNGCRSQAQFSVFCGPQDHGDEQILRIQKLLEQEYAGNYDFNALAKEYGMGRRTLERHFKRATGETPLAYLQQVRVEHAKQLLETGTASFDEISYQVGYMDSSFFRKLFIKYTSLKPSQYRTRFSNSAFCNRAAVS